MRRRPIVGCWLLLVPCVSVGAASPQEAATTSTNRVVQGRGCIGSPAFDGKLDIEVSPAAITLGQPYAIKVYLKNTGTSAMKLTDVSMTPRINAQNEPMLESSLAAKDVPIAQRLLVAEGKGAWGDEVRVWVLLVRVTGDKGDTCQDRIALRKRD